MTLPQIDNATARALFLARHGLAGAPTGSATGAALQEVVTDLGFVQVDSVSTVARAHDMILWSRRQAYRPESLRWLNDCARGVFEHWTHDAAMIPVAFFPYWRLKFDRDAARLRHRWKDWQGSAFHGEIDTVLRHVTLHGAVCTADMAGDRPEKSTGWWDWHPSKTALEYLWRSGKLAVTKREGFRKHYDLTERVIPPEALAERVSEAETVAWACTAALDRLGFATHGELAAFWDLIRPHEARAWVAEGLRSGRLVEVEVACHAGPTRRVVMWPAVLEGLDTPPEVVSRLRILSPFDPALRDRARAERLFGFHYRIEIFVPASQRKYGYYVFPAMEGAAMIGRIDMTADRTTRTLRVTAFWPEAGVRMGKGRFARLEGELTRMARLAQCEDVTFAPGWLRETPAEG